MPRVLIVDDTAVDRRIAGGLLEESGEMEIEYAENGGQALAHMEQSLPDIVVTDLQMPEMDGLDLVTMIRLRFPHVPVILITARGSETLAIEALERGAASYVPKSQLTNALVDTVQEVLSLAHADHTYERLMKCQQRIEFKYLLENDPALVDALVDLIQQMISGMDLSDHTGRFRIGIAVREALLNALYRGNLEIDPDQMQDAREDLLAGEPLTALEERRSKEPYKDRQIEVDVCLTHEEARFVIRDQGPGFDHNDASTDADATAGSLTSEQGRGMVLMRSFMDEVRYNDKGNEVTLVKRRDSQ